MLYTCLGVTNRGLRYDHTGTLVCFNMEYPISPLNQMSIFDPKTWTIRLLHRNRVNSIHMHRFILNTKPVFCTGGFRNRNWAFIDDLDNLQFVYINRYIKTFEWSHEIIRSALGCVTLDFYDSTSFFLRSKPSRKRRDAS